jgi:hypothetical protein
MSLLGAVKRTTDFDSEPSSSSLTAVLFTGSLVWSIARIDMRQKKESKLGEYDEEARLVQTK